MTTDRAVILAEFTDMLVAVMDRSGVDEEVTMETTFREDLGMESIDVVALAGRLQARYGGTVNFALFMSTPELEAERDLRVGQLVEYIAESLDRAGQSSHGDAQVTEHRAAEAKG
ncbi:phosphopantetheine-binding protein [Micromonospora sp. WMMA1363]|uniref:acyl carrier protein n=1 Tax=Micromonospora sp. WMMA1363 TaxID=3053985 RepID=UPI00259CEAB8|nr:phosphopantetheine-binding protein [Micromonospora sp. WMMA1363]MDM4721114.1 phosphopantetheine-binding protein [Micromonospora sp. WMMA1363]